MGRSTPESVLYEPLFQERQAVVAPEALAAEEADGDTEDLVSVGFLDAGVQRRWARAREVGPELGGGMAELGDQVGDRLGQVDLELAAEEAGK